MARKICLLITIILLTSACESSGANLTLAANHSSAGTRVANLRVTASVQAARAETTLDFMGTRAALGATQSNFLEATLIATGISADALATQRQIVLGNSPTPLPTPTLRPEETREVVVMLTPTATVPPVTLNAPNPTSPPQVQPTISESGLFFGNVITATGAGVDGCGAGVTTTFSTNVEEIYVIVPVFNVIANTNTFAARWARDGQAVGPVYTFTPEFDAEELCVWFFVDETDFEFSVGSYTVTLDVDNQPITNPVSFVIQ